MLVNRGADIKSRNKQGLDVMHVAAQGDQPLVLAFFYDLGQPIDSLDEKKGTPLHWATYLGCEMATAVLLAWNPPLHLRDADGQTPLHLGTIAGNSRIVRNLLLKGANRDEKDDKGRTAIHIAEENKADSLIKLLQPPGRCSVFSIRPPLRPYRKTYISYLIYVLLFPLGSLFSALFTDQSEY